MNNYICTNYNDKYDTIKQLIIQRRNIYVYGNGNNGKDYVLNEIKKELPENIVTDIIKCVDIQDYSIHKNILTDKIIIIHDNEYNPSSTINNFVKVEFLGNYDSNTNSYI